MQLGTRWSVGTQPPTAVPAALHAEIARVEESMIPDGLAAATPRWTLTFLEGRPVAELETGTIVTLDHEGNAVVRHDEDDEFA
ncbi:hypothetical protein FHX48_001043 [Microbacterium halimionae]|uniref:Fe-S oxidoreductase n=1 Tax=Microbacterium halimionae TaxID=1526413 RepID=A0A7W3PKX3_9MICO|nr:hypothetical protein [Microbacterium halimionae]MBA8815970.1 hypothetical protein [Microbacterium halimionae]NII96173.1 hypothetical protein [Microbacterium halimionae]